jgi:homoserine dehydrogenase
MIGAGFLNLPPWQDKLQLILNELNRSDLLRIPVLGTENVEHPWVALEPEDFFSAVSTGIIFSDDYRLKRLPDKIITADAEVAIRRLLAGKTGNTFYKGSIGASYPFLQMLADDKKHLNKFYVQNDAVAGFILAQMENELCSLDKAIATAQWEKIASSNPSPNLHGIVTRNRLILQMAEIFGCILAPEKIPTVGISSLSLDDVKIADFMGFSIRLLGVAELTRDGVRASVEPCMLPRQYFLAQARKGSEIFYAVSDKEQAQIYSCPGTSFETLVKGVISDLDEVSRDQVSNRHLKVVSEVETFSDRYYLRFSLVNLTSTMAQILNLFSAAGIEVEEIFQPEIEVSRETESSRTVIFQTAKTEQAKLSLVINRIEEQIKLATVVSCFKLFR